MVPPARRRARAEQSLQLCQLHPRVAVALATTRQQLPPAPGQRRPCRGSGRRWRSNKRQGDGCAALLAAASAPSRLNSVQLQWGPQRPVSSAPAAQAKATWRAPLQTSRRAACMRTGARLELSDPCRLSTGRARQASGSLGSTRAHAWLTHPPSAVVSPISWRSRCLAGRPCPRLLALLRQPLRWPKPHQQQPLRP